MAVMEKPLRRGRTPKAENMKTFILKRTVKYYEYCEIEAENAEEAAEIYFNGEDESLFDWKDSQLGEDTNLDSIEDAKTGKEYEVDEKGRVEEA